MHLRGKDFTYTAVYPDGTEEILLSVPAYDFAWQNVYRLTEPKLMPRGTRIDCLAHFDNSPENPANPDPTQTVSWGSQSWEEMMTGYIDYAEDLPASGSVRPASGPDATASVRTIHKTRDQSVDTPSPFCQSPSTGARKVDLQIYNYYDDRASGQARFFCFCPFLSPFPRFRRPPIRS